MLISEAIYTVSKQEKFPWPLTLAIVAVESAFRPTAISSAGAFGLMQLMPYMYPDVASERIHTITYFGRKQAVSENMLKPEYQVRLGIEAFKYFHNRVKQKWGFKRLIVQSSSDLIWYEGLDGKMKVTKPKQKIHGLLQHSLNMIDLFGDFAISKTCCFYNAGSKNIFNVQRKYAERVVNLANEICLRCHSQSTEEQNFDRSYNLALDVTSRNTWISLSSKENQAYLAYAKRRAEEFVYNFDDHWLF